MGAEQIIAIGFVVLIGLELLQTVKHYLSSDKVRADLRSAGMAVVPFQAFGMSEESGWMRLSVGAVSPAAIEAMLPRVEAALRATS